MIKKHSSYLSIANRQKKYHLAKWQKQNFISKMQYYHVDKLEIIYCENPNKYPLIKYFSYYQKKNKWLTEKN